MAQYYFYDKNKAIEFADELDKKYKRYNKFFAVLSVTNARYQVCGMKHAIQVEMLGRVRKIVYATHRNLVNIVNGRYTPTKQSDAIYDIST